MEVKTPDVQTKDVTCTKPCVPEGKEDAATTDKDNDLLYAIDECPPWYICILLGFQHYIAALGSILAAPLLLAGPLCFGQDMVGLSEYIATFFFVAGLATLLQTSIGIRLPIVQGASFAYLAPALVVLNLPQWQCPNNTTDAFGNDNLTTMANQTREPHREVWQSRLREIQGAVCIACIVQVLVGASGVLSLVLRFIGPLTIAPTITLIGLSLFEFATNMASTHWWIAITTIILIAVFSEYLGWVKVPLPTCGRKSKFPQMPIFRLFPILFAVVVSWILCFILTATDALPSNPTEWGYLARTDIKSDVIRDSSWFRVPYPGQWGVPTVSFGAVFGMVAGVLASMIESIGDYYACAKLSGAPPLPSSAVNRGIAVEGVGSILAGLIGSANGVTSYTQNVGALGITKVGSLRVVQMGGLILLLMGCIGKVGAIFITIPEPVVGGLFMSMFGICVSVGISNLQHVNLNSSRNQFVIASSFFCGLAIPFWVARNESSISTGVPILDQIIQVLLSTSMFVGGAIGFALDATLPGTLEDRGIIKWLASTDFKATGNRTASSVYELPLCGQRLRAQAWTRFLPLCPASDKDRRGLQQESTNSTSSDTIHKPV